MWMREPSSGPPLLSAARPGLELIARPDIIIAAKVAESATLPPKALIPGVMYFSMKRIHCTVIERYRPNGQGCPRRWLAVAEQPAWATGLYYGRGQERTGAPLAD